MPIGRIAADKCNMSGLNNDAITLLFDVRHVSDNESFCFSGDFSLISRLEKYKKQETT